MGRIWYLICIVFFFCHRCDAAFSEQQLPIFKEKLDAFATLPLDAERIVTLFESSLYGIESYSPEIRIHLREVDALVRQGLLGDAMAYLEILEKKNPRNPALLVYLGDIYYVQGMFSLAREKYLTVLRIAQGMRSIAYFAVLACQKSFDYEGALNILDEYFSKSGGFLFLRLRGEILYAQGAYRQAAEYFEKALDATQNQSEKSELLLKLGLLYKAFGKLSDAENYLKQLAAAGNKQGCMALADLYQSSGENAQSLAMLDRCSVIDPGDKFLRQKIAMLCVLTRDYQRAEGIFSSLIQQDPQDELSRVLFLLLKEEKKAVTDNKTYQMLLKELSLGEFSLDYRIFILSKFLEDGMYSDYIERLIDEIIAHNVFDEDLLRILGVFLLKQEKFEKARLLLEESLNINPFYGRTYFFLGTCLYHQHQDYFAEYYFRKAVAFDAKNGEAFNFLANIFLERREFSQALNFAQKALFTDPKNPFFLDTLGWVWYQKKNYSQAKSYIEKAVWNLTQSGQDDYLFHEHLAEVYYALRQTKDSYDAYYRAFTIAPKEKRPQIEEKMRIVSKYLSNDEQEDESKKKVLVPSDEKAKEQ